MCVTFSGFWLCHRNLPISLYNIYPIAESKDNVVISPRLAAMGVATLSGFIWHLLENNTTPTIIQPANTISTGYHWITLIVFIWQREPIQKNKCQYRSNRANIWKTCSGPVSYIGSAGSWPCIHVPTEWLLKYCLKRCNTNIICLNTCFVCSKEASHWDSSFEYQQHMFRLRNKKKWISFIHSLVLCQAKISI